MDKNKLMDSGIDYDEGVGRFSGNAEIYEKFLLKFKEDKSFQELDQAMKDHDYGTAFTAAHTLKGVTGNLSINVLYQELVPFVELLRTGAKLAEANAYYPRVAETYHQVMDVLNKLA